MALKIGETQIVFYTAVEIQLRETQKDERRIDKEAKVKEEAEKLMKSIKTLAIKVGAKAGESGKIFGSVNTIQLADSLKKLGFDVDRKYISIKGDSIKTLGTYEATIKLHKDVVDVIKFDVIEE